MSEYTPTTEQVRRYWQYGANAWADGVARDSDTQADGTSIAAEFDRWLAAEKAKWQAEALRDHRRRVIRLMPPGLVDRKTVIADLDDYADRIEKGRGR